MAMTGVFRNSGDSAGSFYVLFAYLLLGLMSRECHFSKVSHKSTPTTPTGVRVLLPNYTHGWPTPKYPGSQEEKPYGTTHLNLPDIPDLRSSSLSLESYSDVIQQRLTALRGTKHSLRRKESDRNITVLLENLLKNYDKSQRPDYGVPTIVYTNVMVKSMGPVSELDMSYQMDCYFRQSWHDKRLRFKGPISTLSLNIKMLEGIWKPDTYFLNGQDSYIHTITRPNKLLRIEQDGKVLYSVRLTVKAKCPMALHKFPMDSQSCPLIFGSYAYTKEELIYHWSYPKAVTFARDMALSQFDLINSPHRNTSIQFRTGEFSVLQVNFNLQRHTGYFLIQVYVPCVLIVVLSWVSFWINREATSDRVGLGITTVLTLSTFGLDSRTDLPKVHYATAIDWFMVMCFTFVIATLLEFAGVHYFTKVGSGEIYVDSDDEWEDMEVEELDQSESPPLSNHPSPIRCKNPVYRAVIQVEAPTRAFISSPVRRERERRPLYLPTKTVFTQTDVRFSCCRQFLFCLLANENFRLRRQPKTFDPDVTNSVSKIDRVSRVIFPLVFILLNCLYWLLYSQQPVSDDWMQMAANSG